VVGTNDVIFASTADSSSPKETTSMSMMIAANLRVLRKVPQRLEPANKALVTGHAIWRLFNARRIASSRPLTSVASCSRNFANCAV